MIKVAIVDDNKIVLEEVYNVVREFNTEYKMGMSIKTYNNSEILFFDIKENVYYDLYILDVEMPVYSGLNLAGEIRSRSEKPYIILLTSYFKYSICGYELGVFRYITKDKIQTKLKPALKNVCSKITINEEKFYLIQTMVRSEKISLDDVLYIYKDGKNSVFQLINNEDGRVRKSLKDVFDEIDLENFIFIDRGYIVNIHHISKVVNNEVLLSNEEILIISRPNLKKVKMAIFSYLGAQI